MVTIISEDFGISVRFFYKFMYMKPNQKYIIKVKRNGKIIDINKKAEVFRLHFDTSHIPKIRLYRWIIIYRINIVFIL